MVKRVIVTFDDEEYKLFKAVKGSKKDGSKAKQLLMSFIYRQESN